MKLRLKMIESVVFYYILLAVQDRRYLRYFGSKAKTSKKHVQISSTFLAHGLVVVWRGWLGWLIALAAARPTCCNLGPWGLGLGLAEIVILPYCAPHLLQSGPLGAWS